MRISFIFFSFLFSVTIFGQENHPSLHGERIINKKIEKYHKIDTLNYYSQFADFQVSITEGKILIKNVRKKIFGSGGFSVNKFTTIKTGNILKIEYEQALHLYKDEEETLYLNSESQSIFIFFNEENKPDLAKILINQYTNDKVISSQIYYLNLAENSDYFIDSTSEKLTEHIFQIIKKYK